ncbi:hypothetical protein C7451_11597 [Blastomonas natatoria]|uniref:Uncharacterized protein n=1 Tax=Blastomonas natatoria TaxID=34015 RepID=A0A2V3UUD3_9SPHN|nr:hypothetical protein C7451_11597 [Blastomonas natatoria]
MLAARSQQRDLQNGKAKFGGLEVSEAKRLRQLDTRNKRGFGDVIGRGAA